MIVAFGFQRKGGQSRLRRTAARAASSSASISPVNNRRALELFSRPTPLHAPTLDRPSPRDGTGGLRRSPSDLNGEGVPRDYVQAHKWFNLAVERFWETNRRTIAVENRDLAAASGLDSWLVARSEGFEPPPPRFEDW